MFTSWTPRFEGKCEDLKGHIYDCADIRQGDQYSRTTKEISEYVGRTFKFGMDTKLSIEKLQLVVIPMPSDPPLESTRTDIRIWEKRIDDYVKRETSLKENIKTTYSLIWGQCSDAMRQKVESVEGFKGISEDGDAIELLKALKDAAFNFQTQKYTPQAIHEAKRRFYNCYQQRHHTIQGYLETFQNNLDVLSHIGGSIGQDMRLLEDIAREKEVLVAELREPDKVAAYQQYVATAFILGADRNRVGKLSSKMTIYKAIMDIPRLSHQRIIFL